MNNKAIYQIILCFLIASTNVLIELYPIGKFFAKRKVCEIDIPEYIMQSKVSDYVPLYEYLESEDVHKINMLQTELCNRK